MIIVVYLIGVLIIIKFAHYVYKSNTLTYDDNFEEDRIRPTIVIPIETPIETLIETTVEAPPKYQ